MERILRAMDRDRTLVDDPSSWTAGLTMAASGTLNAVAMLSDGPIALASRILMVVTLLFSLLLLAAMAELESSPIPGPMTVLVCALGTAYTLLWDTGDPTLGACTTAVGLAFCLPKAAHLAAGRPEAPFLRMELRKLMRSAADGSMPGGTYASLHAARCNGVVPLQGALRWDRVVQSTTADRERITELYDSILTAGEDAMATSAHAVARELASARQPRPFGCPIGTIGVDIPIGRLGRLVRLAPHGMGGRIWETITEQAADGLAAEVDKMLRRLETEHWQTTLHSLLEVWEGSTADLIETVDRIT